MKRTVTSKIIITPLFFLLGLIALQIPFTRLLGSGVNFTLYDFMAPSFGVFIATLPGILTVFLIQLVNFLLHPEKLSGLAAVIRLFPVLFALIIFGKKRNINLVIPLLSILLFNLHPIGRSAWQYSLMWFIPVRGHYFRKNLFVRSLAATYTAHAVGGVLWVWAFGLSREIWLALIPQSLMERLLMAGGISVSYYSLVNVLSFLKSKKIILHKAFTAS